MSRAEPLLFTVDGYNTCRIGLPPVNHHDQYKDRAMTLGKLHNYRHVFFNPKGHMFVTSGKDLYKGPTASSPWDDWYKTATCVGKSVWDQFRFLKFSPAGDLHAVTNAGVWYKGPEPDNANVPWLYKKASVIGNFKMDLLSNLFFDPEGRMYVLYDNKIRYNPTPYKLDAHWLENSVTLGTRSWYPGEYFKEFSSDGNLWSCLLNSGALVKLGVPSANPDYVFGVVPMGVNYSKHEFPVMTFTEDRTICKVLKVDLLADIGRVLSQEPEFITEKCYDNKGSTTPLKSTFEVDKICIAESQYGHEHGFEFSAEAETTFETGLPLVNKGTVRVAVSTTTSHKWNFLKINRTETHFKMSSDFELEPGKAVRQRAIAQKANTTIPYRARVLTVFGYETNVSGNWNGVCFFDLRIKQTDE